MTIKLHYIYRKHWAIIKSIVFIKVVNPNRNWQFITKKKKSASHFVFFLYSCNSLCTGVSIHIFKHLISSLFFFLPHRTHRHTQKKIIKLDTHVCTNSSFTIHVFKHYTCRRPTPAYCLPSQPPNQIMPIRIFLRYINFYISNECAACMDFALNI